jgi:hypothetical protein
MTFAEVELACRGYETRMARVKEVPRLIAAILVNTNLKKGARRINPEEVFPLFTDGHRKVQLMTKEEFENFKELRKSIKWQVKDLRRN